jgi:hypothetical protein
MDQPKPVSRRVAAALENLKKRKGFTPEGLQRVREAMIKFKPWRFSTGPRTPEGKARVAQNGRYLQKNPISQCQIRRLLADTGTAIDRLEACRKMAEG